MSGSKSCDICPDITEDFRETPGNRNYRELLNIIQMRCEENRVSFGSVNPCKTGQTCPACSHAERGNRVSENFRCLKCGYSGQADILSGRLIFRHGLPPDNMVPVS